MPSATIWDQVLSRIEDQVGRHSFSTWFKPTSLLSDDGQTLSIRVPNLLFVEWLPKHYSVVLAEAVREAGRPDAKLVFVPDAAAGARRGVEAARGSEGPDGPRSAETPAPHVTVTNNEPEPFRAGGLIPRVRLCAALCSSCRCCCLALAPTPALNVELAVDAVLAAGHFAPRALAYFPAGAGL